MRLRGKTVAMFIANMFEDVEHVYPYYRMLEEGATVRVIGPAAEVYPGKHGVRAKADLGINQAEAADFDALLIPGGFSPDYMRRTDGMVKFVKDMHDRGKPIAAICHGPWMLASADIIDGVRLTSFKSIKDDLVHAGAQWVDQEVVIDENIITSRGPDDLPAYCRTVVEHVAAVQTQSGVRQ